VEREVGQIYGWRALLGETPVRTKQPQIRKMTAFPRHVRGVGRRFPTEHRGRCSARTACTHATDIDSPALLLHRLFAFVLADLDHPLFALAASLIRIGGFLEALLARFRARRRAKHRATSGSRKRRVNRFRRAQPVSARRTSEVYGASWTKRKCGGGPSPCQLRGGSLPHEKNFVRFLGQAVVAFQHTTERRRRRRLL
jgi:hypothetical protein